jgi:hypothetical protein
MEYTEVKETVQALVSQGIYPSKERVRAALGGGSYATVQPLLAQARRELGLVADEPDDEAPPETPAHDYPALVSDPARVAAIVGDLQGRAALDDLLWSASHAAAHLELFLKALPQAQVWAWRRGDPTGNGDGRVVPSMMGGFPDDVQAVAGGLRHLVHEAQRRVDLLEQPINGEAA